MEEAEAEEEKEEKEDIGRQKEGFIRKSIRRRRRTPTFLPLHSSHVQPK
jgi:hypothetical protein